MNCEWYVARRIACQNPECNCYPLSEARFADMEEYLEYLESLKEEELNAL